jgi:tRNA(fMet)-specific endonuclease VapC
MLQYLFDTDHLTLYERGHAPVVKRVLAYPPDTVGVSAITVEEALRGRLGYLSRPLTGVQRVRGYALLVNTSQLIGRMLIAAFDDASEAQYQLLRTQRLRIGTQDLRIAAVALTTGLTLLTRNHRDFGRIAGLSIDDWSL